MKSILVVALSVFSSYSAASGGTRLEAAVIKMGTCYMAEGGAIEFMPHGRANWLCLNDGNESGPYSGSYGDAYGGESYGPYDNGYGYGNGRADCSDFITTWRVSGQKVLLNIGGEYRSVVIGFRSATCSVD